MSTSSTPKREKSLDPSPGERSREGVKLPHFAFEISREIGASIRGQKLLMAVSGGVDSIALADVLLKLAPRFDLQLAIAHIHHGPQASTDRDDAKRFVANFARERGLEIFLSESNKELKSEAELRDFRQKCLTEIVTANGFDRVALGHHADDLFETRLMRLVRGTGPQGLRAMSQLTPKLVRPFLTRSRADIVRYANEQKLSWIEDSSNRDTNYFRNWIRNEWLPLLDRRQPGSQASFARSLDLLSEAAPRVTKVSPKFRRQKFVEMTDSAKKEWLLAVANLQGVRDFGHSKIIEVLKRLDRLEVSRQRRDFFTVGGVSWTITSQDIIAAPSSL